MNIKRIKDRGGFVFLEVLIASSILVVVSGAIISLFIWGSNLWQLVIAQNELRSGASTAIYQMTKELQSATRTTSPLGAPPNLTIPTAIPAASSVNFYLPDTTNTNSINIEADGSTVTDWIPLTLIQYQYISASKQLSRSTQGVSKVICNNVASVVFQTIANDRLRITLRVEKSTLMGIKSTTVTSIIKLRN